MKSADKLCWMTMIGLVAGWLAVGTVSAQVQIDADGVPRSSPKFYIDPDKAPPWTGMYVVHSISSSSAQSDIWVKVDSFTGGVVSLADNEDGKVSLGAIAAGETKMAYFYLKATIETITPQG